MRRRVWSRFSRAETLASSSLSSPDYAGFWQRAAALVIDWLIVIVIAVPVMVLGFGLREVSLDPAEHSWDLLAPLAVAIARSEEHTSELQSQSNLVCRLLL